MNSHVLLVCYHAFFSNTKTSDSQVFGDEESALVIQINMQSRQDYLRPSTMRIH